MNQCPNDDAFLVSLVTSATSAGSCKISLAHVNDGERQSLSISSRNNVDVIRRENGSQKAYCSRLPFRDATIDRIIIDNYHELSLSEKIILFRECRRLLKDQGRINVAVHENLDDEAKCVANLTGLIVAPRADSEFNTYQQLRNRQFDDRRGVMFEFGLPDRKMIDYPLVSILIPAYRATFFRQALQSAISQTYRNIEIIVSDDSPDTEIENIVNALETSERKIMYSRNTPALGEIGNYYKCFIEAKGEFIKYLNDDDVLHDRCVDKMISVFKRHHSVTLVTSRRSRIGCSSERLEDTPATRKFLREDAELNGASTANALLRHCNFIGEPTTTMFRKKDLEWVKPHFMAFGGSIAYGYGDVAMWLYLLGRGNAYYLVDTLSSLRIHKDQGQLKPESQRMSVSSRKRFLSLGKYFGLSSSRRAVTIQIRKTHDTPWHRYILIALSFDKLHSKIGSVLRRLIRQ